MDRRRFLAALLGGAVLDTDKLLWRPGAKLISIPAPRIIKYDAWVEYQRAFKLYQSRIAGRHAALNVEVVDGRQRIQRI